MDTCICGRPIEDRSTRCSRCAALHEIGLEAGASDADIKSAYRAHVKAWHPDRYADDKSQQRAAELKLKKVNAAYDLLNAPEPQPMPQAPPEPRSDPRPERWQEAYSGARPQATPYTAWEQSAPPDAAPAAASDFSYSTWAHSHPRPPAPYVDIADEESDSSTAPSHGAASPRSKTSFIYAALIVAVVAVTYYLNSAQTKPSPPRHAAATPAAAAGAGSSTAPQPQYTAPVVPDFFTLGSLKSDVVAVQGNPSSIEDNKYLYGLSSVTFENDKVAGWNVNPLNPLKVRLNPHSQPSSDIPYFTLGSMMDEVIAIEGTPTAVWADTLQYGASTVRFDADKVVGWDVKPANPLKVKLVAASHPDNSLGYFSSGSSKDEVVAIQGTPTSIWENTYQYGKSSVTFQDDKVIRWSVYPANPLRVRAPR